MDKFKPFDKVLVSVASSKWHPDLYAYYDEEEKTHIVIGLGVADKCIHFEGNENLIGTFDNPPPEPDFNLGDKVEVRSYDSQKWIRAIFTGYEPSYEKRKFYLAVSVYDITKVDRWEQCRHADW